MFLKNTGTKVHTLITEQIKDVEGCLTNYENFMRAASENADFTTLKALCDGVHEMENAADRSLRQMIDSLGSSYLPATRSELIEIATSCDSIANKCEHTALMLVLRKFRFPEYCAKDVMEIVTLTRAQYELLKNAISQLFSNFGELLKDHSILDEIRGYESKIDVIEKKLYEEIYAKEEIRLSERMLVAEFVEWICDVSDIIEDIADKIQIMLITRKA